MNIDNYGFIITRHVNSEKTNMYWNRCVRCIRTFYPLKKIVIIDDNSDQSFVKDEFNYRNVIHIQSEFPGRGELLPYYYFHKNKFFENAVIIHDSVFFHERINFDNIRSKAMPLWHFHSDKENVENTIRISSTLLNNFDILKQLNESKIKVLGFNNDLWYGCFGCQSFINHYFLNKIQDKYQLFNLLHVVINRSDRCCLERIIGIIFISNIKHLYKKKSLFGNIMTYSKWGTTYDQYCQMLKNKQGSNLPLVKVWTGR